MESDQREPWKRPFAWPPSQWKFSKGMQTASEVASAILLLIILYTVLMALFSWVALLHQLTTVIMSNDSERIQKYILAMGALIGAPFLIWRTIIASQQISINRESLYTQLFTTGVERLGAEKTIKVLDRTPRYKTDDHGKWLTDDKGDLIPATRPDGKPIVDIKTYERTVVNREVRLGAVYALERVALDSKRDSIPILETLAEFIKNNLPNRRDDDIDIRDDKDNRPACQAAINVIGRLRSFSEDQGAMLDITNTDLSDISLSNAEYKLISFAGSLLDRVSLWNVDFIRCDLQSSQISLAHGKNLSFKKCSLNQSKISFGQVFDLRMSDFGFMQSELHDLEGKNITFEGGRFGSSRWFGHTYIEDATISRCSFDHAIMGGATFVRTKFDECSFHEADLSFCNFVDCEFNSTTFTRANLTGARLDDSAIDISETFTVSHEEMQLIETEVRTLFGQTAVIWSDAIRSRVKLRWHEWLTLSKDPT